MTDSWLLAGRAAALQNEGDWIRFDTGVDSVLVTRSAAGLRGFHNVCQHRGHRLCKGSAGCAKAFTCPYHHWSYGLDGHLLHVPDVESFGVDFDPRERGLRAVAVAEGNGGVFVHLGDPQPLTRVQALFAGPGAVVLEGAIDPGRCAAVVAALTALRPEEHPFSPVFAAHSIGVILDHAPDEDEYFDALPVYHSVLAAIDEGDLEGALLARLAAEVGHPVKPVSHPERGPYGPTTLRRLPKAGIIPPHCETDQLRNPMHAALCAEIDTAELVSWYVCLQAPQSGGELAIHSVPGDSELGRRVYRDRMNAAGLLAGTELERIAPRAGDLVIFNGGRHFHQVLPVGGDRDRWTMGGFLCRTRDGGYGVFS